MTKKRLFIHIGSHKTATTFLQNSFARNQDVLDDLGILYPKAGRVFQAHFRLTWALRSPEHQDAEIEDVPEWAALFDEFDASPHDICVVSSEEFSFRFDPSRLEALRNRYDVTIVYYLRSPDSFMESFYNQFVKDFGTRETRRIDTYMAEQDLHFLDTSRVLRPWSETFGKDAIRLRLFGRQFLPDGIMKDFLKTLGCTRFPDFAPSEQSILQKVSLPPDALEYLRLSNRWLTREEGHYMFVVQLAEMAQEHGPELQQCRAGILSLKARQALRLRFRDSNARAAQTYLGQQRTPFPPMDAPPPPEDYDRRLPEATPELMGRVAAMIRNYL